MSVAGGNERLVFFSLSVCPSVRLTWNLGASLKRREQAGKPEKWLGDEVTRGHHRSKKSSPVNAIVDRLLPE